MKLDAVLVSTCLLADFCHSRWCWSPVLQRRVLTSPSIFCPTEPPELTVKGRWESFITPCLSSKYSLNSKIEASHSHHLNSVPGLSWVLGEGFTSLNTRLINLDFAFILNIYLAVVDPSVNICLSSQYSPSVFQGYTGQHCPHIGAYLKFIVRPQVNMCWMDAGKSHCNEDSQRYCNSTGYCRNFWMYSPFGVTLT